MRSQDFPRTCANCRYLNAPDANYCQRCGEPVSPEILRELQQMYGALKELDTAVGAGAGQTTVAEFRKNLLERYHALRKPQTPTPPLGAAPVTVPLGPTGPSAPAFRP